METLRATLTALTALTLISGAVELLVSGGSVRNFARFVCGLLMMMAMIAPLSSLLSIEPAARIEETQEAMLQIEEITMDNALLTQRAKSAAESLGAKVQVRTVTGSGGAIDGVELTVLDGDPEAARYALCTALGLTPDQVVFR